MERAICLAKMGGGHVHPNPYVGAVIVRDGKIIAEGYHHKCGDLHAERDALKNAAESNADVSGAVMYVTLEPCCHTGRQPPCTEAIIASGIKTVVVGSRDPNSLVDGKGVKALSDAGINVVRDFMKDECDSLNPVFFHYIKTKMPYVTVKYAVSADGKTSLSTGESKWITGDESRENVHKCRGNSAAVMCGINTVISDDPMLNCRLDDPSLAQGIRVVVDRRLKIPVGCALVNTASEIPVIVFCSDSVLEDSDSRNHAEKLREKNVEVVGIPCSSDHSDLERILRFLGERGVDSVLVESGGGLNSSLFFASGKRLVNEVHVYVAPKIFGGIPGQIHSPVQGSECGSIPECVRLSAPEIEVFGQDVLLKYKVVG